MNSPEIPFTDPRILTLAFGVLLFMIGLFVDNYVGRRVQRNDGQMTRQVASTRVVAYWVIVFGLLCLGAGLAAMFVTDRSVEMIMMAVITVPVYVWFIWAVVTKGFTDLRDAHKVLRMTR